MGGAFINSFCLVFILGERIITVCFSYGELNLFDILGLWHILWLLVAGYWSPEAGWSGWMVDVSSTLDSLIMMMMMMMML